MVPAGLPVDARLRQGHPRQRGVLLLHPDYRLLRPRSRYHSEHALHPRREPVEDRVRPARRLRLHHEPGRTGAVHLQRPLQHLLDRLPDLDPVHLDSDELARRTLRPVLRQRRDLLHHQPHLLVRERTDRHPDPGPGRIHGDQRGLLGADLLLPRDRRRDHALPVAVLNHPQRPGHQRRRLQLIDRHAAGHVLRHATVEPGEPDRRLPPDHPLPPQHDHHRDR